eukprot:jgi/Botrbrau1/8420/Bobra.0237s0040.1
MILKGGLIRHRKAAAFPMLHVPAARPAVLLLLVSTLCSRTALPRVAADAKRAWGRRHTHWVDGMPVVAQRPGPGLAMFQPKLTSPHRKELDQATIAGPRGEPSSEMRALPLEKRLSQLEAANIGAAPVNPETSTWGAEDGKGLNHGQPSNPAAPSAAFPRWDESVLTFGHLQDTPGHASASSAGSSFENENATDGQTQALHVVATVVHADWQQVAWGTDRAGNDAQEERSELPQPLVISGPPVFGTVDNSLQNEPDLPGTAGNNPKQEPGAGHVSSGGHSAEVGPADTAGRAGQAQAGAGGGMASPDGELAGAGEEEREHGVRFVVYNWDDYNFTASISPATWARPPGGYRRWRKPATTGGGGIPAG